MRFFRWPVYDRVLVNLTNGDAIDGVLLEQRGPLLLIGDATLLTQGGEPSPMDGVIFIERPQVLFIQATKPKGG